MSTGNFFPAENFFRTKAILLQEKTFLVNCAREIRITTVRVGGLNLIEQEQVEMAKKKAKKGKKKKGKKK